MQKRPDKSLFLVSQGMRQDQRGREDDLRRFKIVADQLGVLPCGGLISEHLVDVGIEGQRHFWRFDSAEAASQTLGKIPPRGFQVGDWKKITASGADAIVFEPARGGDALVRAFQEQLPPRKRARRT